MEYILPLIFCKQSADNLKYLQKLVCFESREICNHHGHHIIFALVAHLQRVDFCNSLPIWRQIYLHEDEVIAKVLCDTIVWKFWNRFQKSDWLLLFWEKLYLHPISKILEWSFLRETNRYQGFLFLWTKKWAFQQSKKLTVMVGLSIHAYFNALLQNI